MGVVVHLKTGDPLMSVEQVANYTGYSKRWVQHAAKNLSLPSYQPAGRRGRLRFRRSEVDSWLEERRAS